MSPEGRTKTVNITKEARAQVRHKKKYKVTTNSNHKLPLFDTLIKQQFDEAQPDQVYSSDITYIWTQEGWLYLAEVIDLYSRKVVGRSMSRRMTSR